MNSTPTFIKLFIQYVVTNHTVDHSLCFHLLTQRLTAVNVLSVCHYRLVPFIVCLYAWKFSFNIALYACSLVALVVYCSWVSLRRYFLSMQTFNEFFIRELKPSSRPITSLECDNVAVCAAGSRLTGYRTVTDSMRFWIKVCAIIQLVLFVLVWSIHQWVISEGFLGLFLFQINWRETCKASYFSEYLDTLFCFMVSYFLACLSRAGNFLSKVFWEQKCALMPSLTEV